jgi:dienelactone hydrolase
MTHLRFIAAALATAFTLAAGTAQAEVRTQWIEYAHGSTKLKGYLAFDDKIKGKRPAILMVHRWDGMSALTLKNTEMYAKLGYVAFAPDIFGYGQGVLPKDLAERKHHMGIYVKDRPLLRARTQAGLDVLTKNPAVDISRLALVGYCFGGLVGVEAAYAGAPLRGMVAIHGSFQNHDPADAKNVKGRFLILHGAEDKPAPIAQVNALIEQLRAAKVGFQYELYSGADHGFSTPRNPAEERANTQSVASMTRFLKETLGQ